MTYPSGRQELCPECGELFSGTFSGDMHRTGRHDTYSGPDRRRCLTVAEMLEIGMTMGKDLVWRSPSAERKAVASDLSTAVKT